MLTGGTDGVTPMKILFQGGWKEGRDSLKEKELIEDYCLALAEQVVKRGHVIVLTSNRESDKVVAEKVIATASSEGRNV